MDKYMIYPNITIMETESTVSPDTNNVTLGYLSSETDPWVCNFCNKYKHELVKVTKDIESTRVCFACIDSMYFLMARVRSNEVESND